jgi:hypothetical protein
MNTNTGIAILLVVCSIMLLIEHKHIARFLVTIWQAGILQNIAFYTWVVILAILVILVSFSYGFIRYFFNESVRMKADTQLEILFDSMKQKTVKVKKTPLNHARIPAYVKPVKKVRKINVGHGLRSLSIGLRIAGMLPRIKF